MMIMGQDPSNQNLFKTIALINYPACSFFRKEFSMLENGNLLIQYRNIYTT